ncbi:MAG: CARDB domain-containing protein [Mariniblastus sp.]
MSIRRRNHWSDFLKNYVEQLTARSNDQRARKNKRSLGYESLEDRRFLSASGFEPAFDASTAGSEPVGHFASAFQNDGLTRVIVEVNDETFELDLANNTLQVQVGDSVKVVGVEFYSSATEGVFAAEGYMNKITGPTAPGTIDYSDSRWSERASNQAATGSEGVIEGLNSEWVAQAGWDRITLNLVHYTEGAVDVVDRFQVNLQVGEGDLHFDTNVLNQIYEDTLRVGEEFELPGFYSTTGDGVFHNYAEVDIYHSSNTEEIVWAGAIVGNVSEGGSIEGEFLNTRTDDAFSSKWTPEMEGEYILKYYLDPEHVIAETNEGNNEHEIRIVANPEAAYFEVVDAVGDEDTAIELEINTEHESVLIEGVPAGVELSHGVKTDFGIEVDQADLANLTVTPTYNSDIDFGLLVTPILDGSPLYDLTQDLNVEVIAVADGGDFDVQDFEVYTGTEIGAYISAQFIDLDGSESHQVTLSGIPDFITFSKGVLSDGVWTLDQDEFSGLVLTVDYTSDVSDWARRGQYFTKGFEITETLISVEANDDSSTFLSKTFTLTAKQHRWFRF